MSGVLPLRLPGLGAFHLLNAAQSGGYHDRIYIPESDAPGLTIDILRIERIPRTMATAATVFRTSLARERDYGRGADFHAEILDGDAAGPDVTLHAWFAGADLAGDRHVLARIVETGREVWSLSLIRKLHALSAKEIAARQAFLADLDMATLGPDGQPVSSFAEAAIRTSRQIAERHGHPPATPTDPVDQLALLKRASPLHDTEVWALEVILGIAQIEDRTPDALPELLHEFPRILGLAALALDDLLQGCHPDDARRSFERMLATCLDSLARFTLLAERGNSLHGAMRAAAIWRRAAAQAHGLQRGTRSGFEALAAFAAALAQSDPDTMIDIDLMPAVTAIRSGAGNIGAALDALDRIGNEAAFIGRRVEDGRPLIKAACVAGDIAGFLVEILGEHGADYPAGPDGDLSQTLLGQYARVVQRHLDAQSTFFGVDRPSWDKMMREGHTTQGAAAAGQEPASLFYLRPLRSSRRLLMENRFRTDPRFELMFPTTATLLPERVSLEAVLQWGLCLWFRTHALGGPVDLFGMGRSTVLGEWQQIAATRIATSDLLCIVASDSQGLTWELEHVVANDLRHKVVAVLPPDRAALDPDAQARSRGHLASIGFEMPERREAGFILFDRDGRPEEEVPFDAIWDQSLRERLYLRCGSDRG